MKNFLALSLTLLMSSLILNSCEPWEDESYHPGGSDGNVELTGTWKLTALNLGHAYDFNGDGTANADLMVETNCYQNELLTFAINNTGISTSNSYADITITGEGYSTECISETEETPFSWIQTESNVSLTIDDQIINATLAGNTLTFTIPDGFFAGSEEGEEISENIIFTYTKQQ